MPSVDASWSALKPKSLPAAMAAPNPPTTPVALNPAGENPPFAAAPIRIAHSTPST
jgi:hypothetical protein